MALFGSLATLRAQVGHEALFKSSFAYIDSLVAPGSPVRARVLAVAAGKTEKIELGGGVFVLEQAYLSKPREQGFFESHRRFIDVQIVVSGEELLEVADVAKLTVSEDLTPGKDMIKYTMFGGASVLRLSEGEAAIFFPVDGHMPSVAVSSPILVHKAVIKVPVG